MKGTTVCWLASKFSQIVKPVTKVCILSNLGDGYAMTVSICRHFFHDLNVGFRDVNVAYSHLHHCNGAQLHTLFYTIPRITCIFISILEYCVSF